MEALKGEALDVLLLMQVTFTDASMTVRIAENAAAPLAIWAFPEPRTGGRLRLNSFCGLNLAAHALGAGKSYRWLYAARGGRDRRPVDELVAGQARKAGAPDAPAPSDADRAAAKRVLSQLDGRTIGLVGEHPAGFDTCRYDEEELERLAGVQVARIALPALFERARAVPAVAVAATRQSVGERWPALTTSTSLSSRRA